MSESPGVKRYVFVAIVVGILAFLWFRKPEKYIPPKRIPTTKPIQRGASKLWFGIRAKPGPIDSVTQKPKGVQVVAVVPGSPADAAGLTQDDIILEFANQSVSSPKKLAKIMDQIGPGKVSKVKTRRGRQVYFLEVKLENGGSHKIYEATVASALTFLSKSQNEDGSFNHFHLRNESSPSVSALVAWALALNVDQSKQDSDGYAAMDSALTFLETMIADNNGLETSGWDIGHRNYGSACTLLAFAAADKEKYKTEISRLSRFLTAQQVGESHGYDALDWRYGGFPYYESLESSQLRTDVSTVAFVTQALSAAGLEANHIVWRRLGLWLDEAQNYAVSSQDPKLQELETKHRDGGFAFSPRNSKANSPSGTGLNFTVYPSYGSATADGLRALILADGSASHPRAVAALQWLARNYDLTHNPGLPIDGPTPWGRALHYYYLHSLAHALSSAKVARIILTTKGKDGTESTETHHWPAEIIRELARRQLPDGSFKNPSPLMGEDHPIIATSFALLALHAARQALDFKDVITLRAGAAPKPPRWEDVQLDVPSRNPVTRGLIVYRNMQCQSCHKDSQTTNGPSLVGVGDRFLEKFENNENEARAYIKKHIRNPKKYPGTRPWKGIGMTAYSEGILPGPQLDDLVTFLMSRKGNEAVSRAPIPGKSLPADTDVGSNLFKRFNCMSCHHEKVGHAPLFAGIATRYLEAKGSPRAARRAIAQHIRDPLSAPALQKSRRPGLPMTPYTPEMLSEEDLSDLVAYLMTFK